MRRSLYLMPARASSLPPTRRFGKVEAVERDARARCALVEFTRLVLCLELPCLKLLACAVLRARPVEPRLRPRWEPALRCCSAAG